MSSEANVPLLGVDAGGTRTRAVVALGGLRGIGEAGPANWTTLGADRCVAAISEAVARALEAAAIETERLAAACVAVAGYYPPWHAVAARSALLSVLPGVPLRLEPDLVAAWAGATGGRPGIVLVAGTGAVAYGRDAAGQAARAGGWGPRFGDEGSGYWIGIEALRAVARALDGRGAATALSATIGGSGADGMKEDATSPPKEAAAMLEERLRVVYRDDWSREQVASLAPQVMRAAAAGDGVAGVIVERAAAELGALVLAVARKLGGSTVEETVATVGGVFDAGPLVRQPLERWLAAMLPNARWVEPLGPPVEGALRLAEEEWSRCRTS